jgi:hypothetical protein
MKLPALVRRRQIWVPTIWSWFILLVTSAATLLLAGRHLYSFLSPNQPVGAQLLVVEGWMPSDGLDQAIDAFSSGSYERVVTTGGPIDDDFEHRNPWTSYAERARRYLVRHGLPAESVIAAPAPASAQDRSFLNAVMVREWAKRSGITVDALDVFSLGVHSRRSWLVYRMAFGPQVRIGILAARPSDYAPETWWRNSVGAKEVVAETISWLWTVLFFHPAPRGSHDEMWGVVPEPQVGAPASHSSSGPS